MKSFLILVLFFGSALSIKAQDRHRYLMDIYEYNEEMQLLVNRVIDSLGGKYQNLNMGTYKVNGSISYTSTDTALFDFYYFKEQWLRLDQKLENKYSSFSRHGNKGWLLTKSSVNKEVKKLRRLSLDEEEQFSFYRNNLFNYDRNDLQLYYEGEVVAGDISVYVLRLAGFNFGEEMYYISKKTYRPIMKQVHILKGNYQSVIHFTLNDYQQVNGIWLPHKIGIKKGNTSKLVDIYGYTFPVKMAKSLFLKKN